MKILLIISEAPPIRSGIARVADQLTRGLMGRGHQVDVLSAGDIPRLEWGEVRLSSMPLKIFKLKKRFDQYDVIHLHGVVPTFSDAFLLWGLRGLGDKRPRLVYTYHAPIYLNSLLTRPFTAAYNFLQDWMANLADHVVVSTASYAQRLSRYVPPRKLSVVPWGVDYDDYQAPLYRADPFTAVFLGQVRPYKGLPVLLRAAAGLPGMRVWVIGDGHHLDACRRLAERLNLREVTFWGNLPDAEAINLLREAHAIVLPSLTRMEAFGIALLEGMAAGLVPVASHLPGVADLVGNEGFTFPVGDHRALSEQLSRLMDDEALRLHLASLAQSKARLYPWERTVFGYERIFASVTQSELITQPGLVSLPSRPARDPDTVPIPTRVRVTVEEPAIEG